MLYQREQYEHEVDARVRWHEVRVELGDVHVECAATITSQPRVEVILQQRPRSGT